MINKEEQKELRRIYNPEGSELRKDQLRNLELLKYIDAVCKANNLTYWLSYGSVLGAVRHGGYIPWDDDIDISLERKDYNRLRRILIKNPHPQFKIQCHKTDKNYFLFWYKIKDVNSEIRHSSRTGQFFDDILKYKGVSIDVFPVARNVYAGLYHMLSHFNWAYYVAGKLHNKRLLFISRILFYLQSIFVIIAKSLPYFKKDDYLKRDYGIKDTKHLQKWPRKIVLPTKEILFENFLFPGPSNPDKYLQSLYGDYLRMPPLTDLNHHSMLYYKVW